MAAASTFTDNDGQMVRKLGPAVPARGCGAEWLDMLHTGEKLLLAGLRRKIGPEGDLQGAYRRWYREQMDEHDRLVAQTYDRLHAALAERADAS